MACGLWFEFASTAFDASVWVCGLTAYKMQRRERCRAMESEITLNGQTRAREFECGVVAMNKAGEGVMAVLEE